MSEVPCPVCATKTKREALESQLFVWAGVEAIANQDIEQVKAIYNTITPYDGHTAITLLAGQLGDMFDMIGNVDVKATLANYRKHVQASLLACE